MSPPDINLTRSRWRLQDANTAPDGIWAGSTSLSRDVATIVRRMKLLGFNAVRLPFSMADL